MRELTIDELDHVSGGTVFKSSIGGFTFTYDSATRQTTVGAGGSSVTTGPCDSGGGKCTTWTGGAA
jgi:bacteriocin-like protein